MARRRASVVAVAVCAVALGGCAFLDDAPTAGDAAMTALPLADNLVGESCRAQPDLSRRGAENVLEAYAIFCGRWERPSGGVVRVQAQSGAAALMQDYVTASWWRSQIDQRMDCADAEASQLLDGVPALILNCRLRAGGWPYLAVVASVEESIYLADGIPAILPPIERAVGGLSGRRDFDATGAAEKSAAVERLETLLDGRLFGSGDLQDYDRLLRVAQYYNGLKSFAEAEKRYREALEIHRRLMPGDNSGRGDVLMHLALELSNQERFSEAGALLDRADDLLVDGDDPTDYPRLISYRALHAANQQRYREALSFAEEATALRRILADTVRAASGRTAGPAGEINIGLVSDMRSGRQGLERVVTVDIAQSLYVEAAMLARLGRLDQADARIDEAMAILNRYPTAPEWWRSQLYVLRAQLRTDQGDYANAEAYLRRSVQQQRQVFTQSRLEGLALLELGRVYRLSERRDEALAAYREGFAIMARQGGGFGFDVAQPFFELLIAAGRHHPEQRQALIGEMFEIGQQVRGTVTSQTIAVAAARLSSGDQSVGALIRQLQDAQIDRDGLTEALTRAQADETTPPERLARLEARVGEVATAIRDLEGLVQAASPGYNQLIDAPTQTAHVVGLLRPGEALVQILLGDRTSYVFLVTADGVEAHEIGLTRAVAAQVVGHLRTPFDDENVLPEFDVGGAHRLYKLLFGPIERRLAGISHLVVVPSGPLLSLPPAVLVTDPPPAVSRYDYSGVRWLVERHAITVAPSVRAFADLRGLAKPSQAARPFIGFGDFVPVENADILLGGRDLPEACYRDARMVSRAAGLPETGDELAAVAATLNAGPGATVLRHAFTEARVRAAPLSDYRVVYFATHGLLPGELDCWSEPSLLVSRGADAPADDNGLLEASEIVELGLDADLVVLSACNTGGADGKAGGESLTGLARAFFYAGARSLLVTHWVVESRPTVDLMTGAFEQLAGDGQPTTTAEALRLSQLAMMSDAYFSHPYYWAAFTLVGDGGRTMSAPDRRS